MEDQTKLLNSCIVTFHSIMERLKSGTDIAAVQRFGELLIEMNMRLVSGDGVEIPEHLDTAEFRNAWREWIAYRKSHKHSVAPIVLRRQIRILEFGDADQAVEILETAIENTWKGIPDDIWFPTHRKMWTDRLPANSDGSTQPCEAQFEAFWKAYPRPTAKPKAREAFARAYGRLMKFYPPMECIERIMTGVKAYAENADPAFLCHPATWLDADRWDDDPESIGKSQKKSHSDFGKYDPEAEDLPW